MKFKKGKLYKVVKGKWCGYKCAGCILRHTGSSSIGNLYGTVIKRADKICHIEECLIFYGAQNHPDDYKLVEHINMVKFCKKLKKELDENRNIKKS